MSLFRMLILSSILVFSANAQAGFLIEPYLGQSISGDASNGQAGGVDADASLTVYGARLGWATAMGLMLGADFQLGTGKWSDNNGGGETDTENQDLGVFIGYQTMMGLRFNLAYMFQAKTTLKQVTITGLGTGDFDYTGSGFKLGVGYSFAEMGAPWFNVNAEYHMITADKFEGLGTSSDLTNKVDMNAIFLNVSFPFDFDRM